jgi:hypothetical protein
MSRKRGASAKQGRSDQDILNLFLEKSRALAATSLGREGFDIGLQISYNVKEGIASVLDQPDEDAICSFLLAIRQFASEKEPLFLGRVYSMCYLRLGDEKLKDVIKQMRENWVSAQLGGGVNIVIDEVDYSGVKAFDVWVNGWYFHSDAVYRQLLDQVPPEVRLMLRAEFINFVIQVTYLVQGICQVILDGFDKNPAKPGFILLPSV